MKIKKKRDELQSHRIGDFLCEDKRKENPVSQNVFRLAKKNTSKERKKIAKYV